MNCGTVPRWSPQVAVRPIVDIYLFFSTTLHYTVLYYTYNTPHNTKPPRTTLHYSIQCLNGIHTLYYNTTSISQCTTEPDARNIKLDTLECSVVYNSQQFKVLVVTLAPSSQHWRWHYTHYTYCGRAQEKKRWRGSGTAVAKCLSLTAALSFPEPALFQGGPCKKINMHLPEVFQPFGHKFQGNALEIHFFGFVSSARRSYCHINLIHLPNTLQITLYSTTSY